MKQSILGLMFIALGCYCWFSNASGPGEVQNLDRTGSPVSPGFCNECHGGGNFGTEVTLQLLNDSDEPVTEYQPSTAYTLKISITATGAEGYGFQSVALAGDNAGAGQFGSPANGTQITSIDSRDYFEHSSRSNTGNFEIEWTAPEAGTGVVTFYAAGNAVNADFDVTGDLPDTTALTIEESIASGLRDNLASNIRLLVFPGFAETEITARWSPEVSAEHLSISDLAGQPLYGQKIRNITDNQLHIPVVDLPTGIYFVRLTTNMGFQTQKFVKL